MKIPHWFRCAAIIACGLFAVTHTLPAGAAKWDPSAKDPQSSGSKQGAGAQQASPSPWQEYFKKKKKATEPMGNFKKIEKNPKATCSSDVQWVNSGGKSFPLTFIQQEGIKVACTLGGSAAGGMAPPTFCVDSINSKGKFQGAQCLAVDMKGVQCKDAYHLAVPVPDVAGVPMEFSVACSIGTTANKYCSGGGLCVTDPPSCVDSDNSKLANPAVAAIGLALTDKSWSTFGNTYDGNVSFGGGALGTDSCKNAQWLVEKACEQKWDAVKKVVTYTAVDILVDCHSKKMGCEKSKGICVADLCPTVPGNQIDYPHYFTQVIPGGAQTVGSCEPPAADKCPTVAGDQAGFLYDANGDGVKDSCYPLDEKLCSDPDPAKTYPDATIYAYGKELHLGLCTDPLTDGTAQVLHVICDEAGKVTTDITSCQKKMPCEQGKCGTCFDSDGGINWEKPGDVWEVDEITGGYWVHPDGCNGIYEMMERYCYNGEAHPVFQTCPEGTLCESLLTWYEQLGQWLSGAGPACKPGKEPTCVDHDGGENWEIMSYADGTSIAGYKLEEKDKCSSCEKVEAVCFPPNEVSTTVKPCPIDTACKENVSCPPGLPCTLVSLSCEPFAVTPSCTDHDGGQDYNKLSYAESVDPFGTIKKVVDDCAPGLLSMMEAVCEESYCGKTKIEVAIPVFTACPPNTHCEETQGGLSCVPNCSDTDPLNEPHAPGLVTDAGKIAYPDFCENNVLKQYACDPATFTMVPVPPVTCAKGCVNGKCVP